jgi:TIR domain/Pentapeptide repeats (8 copies)
VATVFISYRRQDSDASAGHLYDSLHRRLPETRVFMDVDGVKGGEDFTHTLATALSSTDLLVAVIGPNWVTANKSDGTRRLDDPDDFVVLEIAEALKQDAVVLPVLVQGATMPSAGELPPSIQQLAKHQAMILSSASWGSDVDALATRIETLVADRSLDGKEGSLSKRFDRLRRRLIPRTSTWRIVRGVLVAAACVALIGAGYAAWTYVRGAQRRALEEAAADLQYALPLDTVRAAISRVQENAVRAGNAELVDLGVTRLKTLVVGQKDTTDKGREIRKVALETIKTLRQNDLTKDFAGSELADVDLVDVDLSRAVMRRLSLSGGFLIRTNFAAADLTGANLSATWVRNADFGAATLTGANVDELDWFNAEGFAASQLRAVDLSTLLPCPKDASQHTSEEAFRQSLGEDYAFKWEQLGSDRTQLLKVWAEYAKPGGLCEQVDAWLAAR